MEDKVVPASGMVNERNYLYYTLLYWRTSWLLMGANETGFYLYFWMFDWLYIVKHAYILYTILKVQMPVYGSYQSWNILLIMFCSVANETIFSFDLPNLIFIFHRRIFLYAHYDNMGEYLCFTPNKSKIFFLGTIIAVFIYMRD